MDVKIKTMLRPYGQMILALMIVFALLVGCVFNKEVVA